MLRKLSKIVFLIFYSGLFLNGIPAQEIGNSKRNRALAASKCKEYTAPLTTYFEILPLIAGGKPIHIPIVTCDEGGEQLIIGGQPAKDGEFPHMAAIGFRNMQSGKYEWLCGGTLISKRYVLTAAHCVYKQQYGRAKKVRLGLINLNENAINPHLQEFSIKKIIRHENYKRREKYHDIALLKLDREVIMTRKVRPACLFMDDVEDASNVIATGWGTTETMGSSEILLKVGLQIYSNSVCQRTFMNRLKYGVTDDLLCAGHHQGGKDTCQGDSGGPLVVSQEYNDCVYYIVAVTSFGIGCGGEDFPSVYTRVSQYTDWIVEKIW